MSLYLTYKLSFRGSFGYAHNFKAIKFITRGLAVYLINGDQITHTLVVTAHSFSDN